MRPCSPCTGALRSMEACPSRRTTREAGTHRSNNCDGIFRALLYCSTVVYQYTRALYPSPRKHLQDRDGEDSYLYCFPSINHVPKRIQACFNGHNACYSRVGLVVAPLRGKVLDFCNCSLEPPIIPWASCRKFLPGTPNPSLDKLQSSP